LHLAPDGHLGADRLRNGGQIEAHGDLHAAPFDDEAGAMQDAQHTDVAGRAECMQAREARPSRVIDHGGDEARAEAPPAQARIHREGDLTHRRFLRRRAHLADAREPTALVANREHHVAAEVDAFGIAVQPGVVELAAEAQAPGPEVESGEVGVERRAVRLPESANRSEGRGSGLAVHRHDARCPGGARSGARAGHGRAHCNLGVS
jgi:hypothetical protein